MRTEHLSALALAASFYLPLAVHAQEGTSGAPRERARTTPIDARTRGEARQRFDRGLTLYNAGDPIGALGEFQVAHELTGHPLVLYNLALVHERLGHAAEALDALEKLRAAGMPELGPEEIRRAGALYESALSRVGSLEIRTSTPRASIQVDNVDVGKTPAPPLRLTIGPHLVSLSAPGHEPRHIKVDVARGATEVVEVELSPLAEAPAELSVTSNVPAVDVRAGGQLIGRTPLKSQLLLKPGSYDLEFSREGYVPVRRHVALQAGKAQRVEVEMLPSEAGLRAGGTLVLSVSEESAVVFVDGQPRLDHASGLRLPRGLHEIRVKRAGFFDVVRQVAVRPGNTTVDATLLPTPDYLGDYVSRAQRQRTQSYIAFGAGALLAAGGGAFLLWNQGQKDDAERRFDDYAAKVEASPNATCPDDACVDTLNVLTDDLEAKRQRDAFGWVSVGLGAAGMAAGVLLYTLSDDPERYAPRPETDVFGSVRVGLAPTGIELAGTFD